MKNNIFKSSKQEKNNSFSIRKKDVNNFKTSQKPARDENNIFKETPIKTGFDLNKMDFPDINVNKNNDTDKNKSQTNKTYVNIVNINKPVTSNKEIIIPGWVQIKLAKKGANIYEKKYGDKTKKQLLQEQKNELQCNVNYAMNTAIKKIEDNRNKYADEYDELYGEGAYNELYGMKPFFPSDDESDDIDNEYDYEYESEYSYSDSYIENE
jgi:hypothetical protein